MARAVSIGGRANCLPAYAGLSTFWRRSIQVRVVASTVALSAIVIVGVGWFLLQQTRDGLLDHRGRRGGGGGQRGDRPGRGPARRGGGHRAQLDPAAGRPGRPDPAAPARRAASTSCSAARSAAGADSPTAARRRRSDVDVASIPARWSGGSTRSAPTAYTFTEIIRTDPETGEETRTPGIVVGSQVQLPADGDDLHPLLPLPARRGAGDAGPAHPGLLTAAALLIVLVAGLTWLVTRQVVTPIRMARRVAERLAAGRLQERLRVRGEDDLARLATSFNQMASNLQKQIRQLEELSRVQRQFASDVSHELRTPLTTVRMAGDVLHDARGSLRPGHRASGRAAPDRARPVRDAAGRPAGDQPVRRRRGRARRGRRQPRRRRLPRGELHPPPRRAARRAGGGRGARPALRGGGRHPPRRADRAQPGHQRHRPCRLQRAGAGDRGPARRRRPGRRHRGARLRRRAWPRARRRRSSTGSGGPTRPGPAPAAAPASGCRSPSRTPTCTAAGSRPGGVRARARSSGSRCRDRPATRCATARCRWCRTTPATASRWGRYDPRPDAPSSRPWSGVLPLLGCSQLPTEDPIVETRTRRTSTRSSRSGSTPCPPQPNASKVDIVNGFLDAMTAWPQRLDVAKAVPRRATRRPRGTPTSPRSPISTPSVGEEASTVRVELVEAERSTSAARGRAR